MIIGKVTIVDQGLVHAAEGMGAAGMPDPALGRIALVGNPSMGLEIVEEIGPEVPDRVVKVRKEVQTALKKYFFFAIRRRPVILPFILEI